MFLFGRKSNETSRPGVFFSRAEANMRLSLPPHLHVVIIIAVVVFITALTFASVPSRRCV